MTKSLQRFALYAIKVGSNLLTLLACRLVRLTGKAPAAIHPKHIIHHPAVTWFATDISADDRVLDVGAGTAAQAAACARKGARAVALELNEANFRAARMQTRGLDVRLVRGDATRPLPFRDGSFTVVLALNVLEHFEDASDVLRECARVLAPGGWVAISLPNRDTTWKQRYRRADLPWMDDRDHKHEYVWPEVLQLIETAGLQLRTGPDSIVVDTPMKGLEDLVGAFSLGLYRRLVDRRVRRAARNPKESIGFRCTATKP